MAATQPDATHSESRRDFLRLAALAGASSALVPAAGRAWAQETPKKGGTLRVGFYVEAATMDPHLSGSKIDRQVYHNIYEPLAGPRRQARHQAGPGRVLAPSPTRRPWSSSSAAG